MVLTNRFLRGASTLATSRIPPDINKELHKTYNKRYALNEFPEEVRDILQLINFREGG